MLLQALQVSDHYPVEIELLATSSPSQTTQAQQKCSSVTGKGTV